jgi:hypothetical protein
VGLRFLPFSELLIVESHVQFLRTTSGYAKWMPSIVGFVKWCEWKQLSILFTRAVTFKSTMLELSRGLSFSKPKLSVLATISFDEDVDDRSLSSQLKAIQDLRSSKVVVAMALESTYLRIALVAHARGMISGWAWLGLDTVPLAPKYAQNLEELADANLAFNGWVYFEPHFAAGRSFFDRVHNATRSYFPTVFDEGVFPSPYAAAMYDAVMLFATVANEPNWLPEQGGKAFLNRSIGNVSFGGATGLVKLDASADMLLSYQAVNLRLENGALQRMVVGVFSAETESYSSNGRAIVWPGGALTMPADADERFDAVWLLVGAGVGSAAVLGVLVLYFWKHRAHLHAILAILMAESVELVGSLFLELADLATDWITGVRVIRGDVVVPSEGFKLGYALILCSGTLGAVIAVFYRLRNGRLVHKHMQGLVTGHSVSRAKLGVNGQQAKKHEWELEQIDRAIVISVLALITVAVEGTQRLPASAHRTLGSRRHEERVLVPRIEGTNLLCRFAHDHPRQRARLRRRQ